MCMVFGVIFAGINATDMTNACVAVLHVACINRTERRPRSSRNERAAKFSLVQRKVDAFAKEDSGKSASTQGQKY